MADRLRWLTVCDKALPASRRHYTDLGLTGLNLGQVSLWIHSRIPAQPSPALQSAAADWQHALASAYQLSAFGKTDVRFKQASDNLLTAMANTPSITHRQQQQIAGALERINLTFPRLAERLAPDWQPEDMATSSSPTV